MAQKTPKIRLFVADDLRESAHVGVDRDQAHYLHAVMRRQVGDAIALFNGRDGEWLAQIEQISKRGCVVTCIEQTRPQSVPPDLWLCFAPIKKARTDFIAEKACEMGCRRLVPVFTRHTNSERVRTDRLAAHAVEAAEQCGLMSVPEIAEPVSLDALVSGWDPARQILFCDETGTAPPAGEVLARVSERAKASPWAILIGPEGGFAPEEADRLRALAHAHPAGLGPRVLRADTAAVAALAVWQSVLGDWG